MKNKTPEHDLSIFNPKKIKFSSEIESLKDNSSEEIYLLASKNAASDFFKKIQASKVSSKKLSTLKCGAGGVFFTRSDNVDLTYLAKVLPHGVSLPYVALPSRMPFIAHLIPMSSWGSSLSNILTKKSWSNLKNPLIESVGNNCVMCGVHNGFTRLEAHEIWGYSLPIFEGMFGTQRLNDIAPLCHYCHETHHLGLASINGRLDLVLDRLTSLTGLGKDVIGRYHEYVSKIFDERSKISWGLDLSFTEDLLSDGDSLIVKNDWMLRPDGILSLKDDASGIHQTVFTGAKWRFDGESEKKYLPPSVLNET